jgi:hypothetical protein
MARKASGTVEYRPGRNGAPGRWWGRITCVDGSRPWLDLGAWPNSPQGRERAKEAAAAATERARELGMVATPVKGPKAHALRASKPTSAAADWWEAYLSDRRTRGMSPADHLYRAHVEPHFGDKHPSEYTRDDVVDFVRRLDAKIQRGGGGGQISGTHSWKDGCQRMGVFHACVQGHVFGQVPGAAGARACR